MGKALNNKRKLGEYAENLGALVSDPTTRIDGSALQAGDTYFKTGVGALVYNGSAFVALGGGSAAWDDITGKPSTFTPSEHSHAITDVTGLQTALGAKVTGPASSTDNTIPRFDGTTGKRLQGSGVTVDDSGNLTLNAGTLGYGAGAGGTVTQITSKATSVTLNKPNGHVTTHNAALAAGASVTFIVLNTFCSSTDRVVANLMSGYVGPVTDYTISATAGSNLLVIGLRNNTAGSLSEALVVGFTVLKGSTT